MDALNTESRKRNVAYKVRIGDILKSKPIMSEGRFLYLEFGENKLVRVNILANCIDKYVSDGERKFGSLTIDDASGQIRIKVFGEDVDLIKDILQGDTLQIIANAREWNNEIYLIPEVLKKADSRWLLVRKLEIQNARKDIEPSEKGGEYELKDSVMKQIKEAETDGGIDVDKIIMDTEASPNLINAEIKKLLEEGIIYEPRPGRLRYLG